MSRLRDIHSRLLLDLLALLAGGYKAVTFFDPSAADAADGVYQTLAEAVENAKTKAGPGQRAEVVIVAQVDATGVDLVIPIPAGSIDLDGRVALSNGLPVGYGPRPILDFAEGAILTGARELRNLELRKNAGATPVLQWTGTDDDDATIECNGCALVLGGTASGPLGSWDHGAAEAIRFNFGQTAVTRDPALTVGVLSALTAGGETTVDTTGGVVFEANTLESVGGNSWGMFFEADTVLQPQSLLLSAFSASGGSGPDTLDGQVYDARKAGGLTYWTKAQTFQPGYRSRTVLVREQLEQANSSASSGMITPASVMYQPDVAPTNLAAGDTYSLAKDVGGTVAETWTAVGAAPGAFEFLIDADWELTLVDLARAINADSGTWGAVVTSNLRALGGAGSTAATFKGVALVAFRLSSIAQHDNRVFADTTTSGATVRTVDYSQFGASYSADNTTAGIVMPATDPGVRFGFGYTVAGPADQGQAVYVIEAGVVFQGSIGFGLSGTFEGGWSSPAGDVTPIATAAVTARVGQTQRCDPTGGAFTVSLEDVGPAQKGDEIVVKNVSASANAITIDPIDAAQTIDGAATAMIALARGFLRLQFDGVSDWMIV